MNFKSLITPQISNSAYNDWDRSPAHLKVCVANQDNVAIVTIHSHGILNDSERYQLAEAIKILISGQMTLKSKETPFPVKLAEDKALFSKAYDKARTQTPPSHAGSFMAGVQWMLDQIHANKPKPTKPFRALVRHAAGCARSFEGNDFMPATVTPCADGRWEVVWDHGVKAGHQWWSKGSPNNYETKPLPSEDWVEVAARELADRNPCSLLTMDDERGFAAIIRKHLPEHQILGE